MKATSYKYEPWSQNDQIQVLTTKWRYWNNNRNHSKRATEIIVVVTVAHNCSSCHKQWLRGTVSKEENLKSSNSPEKHNKNKDMGTLCAKTTSEIS